MTVTTFSTDSIQNCTSSCGIYAIRGKYNGFHLVGQTTRSFYLRWKEHLRKAEGGRHDNPYFQHSFTKNGKDNFEFILLEECSENELNERETYWILKLNSLKTENGWNLREGGAFGKYGDELRKKVSDGIRNSKKSQSEKISRRKKYTLISPANERITFVGLRLFCDQNHLKRGSIHSLLSGRSKQINGWKLPPEEYELIKQNRLAKIREDVERMDKNNLPPIYRNCPICGRIIECSTIEKRDLAEKHKRKCKSCAATKN